MGFSLVEITIALGVFVFAILSIIGLLSIGLTTSAETRRDSSLAGVVRSLNAMVRSADTPQARQELLEGTFHFDVVGNPLTDTNVPGFRVTFSNSSQSPAATETLRSLLGFQSAAAASNLILWSATIADSPAGNSRKTLVVLDHAAY